MGTHFVWVPKTHGYPWVISTPKAARTRWGPAEMDSPKSVKGLRDMAGPGGTWRDIGGTQAGHGQNFCDRTWSRAAFDGDCRQRMQNPDEWVLVAFMHLNGVAYLRSS